MPLFRTPSQALCLLRRRQSYFHKANRICVPPYSCIQAPHATQPRRRCLSTSTAREEANEAASPRIAIVGGGPAGLTLGFLLHKRGIPFTIFELRPKPSDEELAKPSGMLDLHDESGLAALRECGVFEKFLGLTGECTEAQKVADKDGNIIYRDEGELSERPEIARHALTQLLSSHLPEGTIKYGHRLLSAAARASDSSVAAQQIELDFAGDSGSHNRKQKQAFDLVIGADGAWSKVRNMLTGVKPYYAGTQNLTVTIQQVTAKYPHLSDLVGRGSFSALGLRHGVMSHRGPNDSARIYVMLSVEDEQFAASSGFAERKTTAKEAKHRFLDDNALLGAWGPQLKELVSVACNEETADNPGAAVDIKPLYMLPIGASWEHKTGATIIGDAAHLMCPWAGEGVNLAMWDALLLAQVITQAHSMATGTGNKDTAASFQRVLDPLLEDFETQMVARAKEKAEETYSSGQMMFSDDAANAFARFFRSINAMEK